MTKMAVAQRRTRRNLAAVMMALAAAWAGIGLTPPLRAHATVSTFNVNTTLDSYLPVPANCSGTPATGTFCTLRAAVMAANVAGGAGQITLGVGTYVLTRGRTAAINTVNDTAMEGDLDVTANLTITGASQATTIIDAAGMVADTNGSPLDRIFKVASGATLNLSNLTLQHGHAVGVARPAGDGGAVLSNGIFNATDVTIQQSIADLDGGGVAQQGIYSGVPATMVTNLTRVTVTANQAGTVAGGSGQLTGDGGGVEQGGDGGPSNQPVPSTININNSHIDGNTSRAFAGGVSEHSGGVINIANSTVNNNIAHNTWLDSNEATHHTADVGGVYETGGGTVNISDSTVSGNTTDSQAGGVNEDGAGGLHISNTTIANNVAGDSAGGIYLDGGSGCGNGCGTVTLDRIAVTGNQVTSTSGSTSSFMGSGAGLNEDGGDIFTLTNSTIANNGVPSGQVANAGSHGSGIYLDGGSPSVTITNVTISGNVAKALGNSRAADGSGGGLLTDSDDNATLTNVTISGNHADNAGGGILSLSSGGVINAPTLPHSSVHRHANRAVAIATLGRTALLNATVAGNTADHGKANVENNTTTNFQGHGGGMFLESSIVAGSPSSNCGGQVGPTSLGYNFDDGTTCAFTATGDHSSTDPTLAALADNGATQAPPGGLQTRALMPGSPAIDSIPAAVCPPPATDERGVTRPQGPLCDAGAYEARAVAPSPTPAPTAAPSPSPSPTQQPAALATTGNGPPSPWPLSAILLFVGLLLVVVAWMIWPRVKRT